VAHPEILKTVEASVPGIAQFLWTRYPPPRPVVLATPEALDMLRLVTDRDGHSVVNGDHDPDVMGYRIIVSQEDPRAVWSTKIAFVDADAEIIEWAALVQAGERKAATSRKSQVPQHPARFPDLEA